MWRIARLLLIVTAAATVTSTACADTCAVDLASLVPIVSDSQLQASLGAPIDDSIVKMGGLDQALDTVRSSVDAMEQAIADGAFEIMVEKQADPVAFRKLAEDSLRVSEAFIEAILCRQVAIEAEAVAEAPEDQSTTDPIQDSTEQGAT